MLCELLALSSWSSLENEDLMVGKRRLLPSPNFVIKTSGSLILNFVSLVVSARRLININIC